MAYGSAIIGGVVALVTGVIGLVVVDSVINATVFSSAILNTITENIPVIAAVSLLALAGAFVMIR